MTRERAVTDWGCPPWRSAIAYLGDRDTLNLSQWRWEFMRRNPVYRAIYLRSEPLPFEYDVDPEEFMVSNANNEDVETLEPMFSYANNEDVGTLESMFSIYDRMVLNPRLSHREFVDDINMRDDGARLLSVPKGNTPDAWLEKFGGSPERDITVLKAFIKKHCSIFDQESEGMVSIAVFNHRRPLPEQLKKVTELVRERHTKRFLQIESFRKRIEHWTRHLRVIDAREQGATHEEIYEQIARESAGDDEEAMDDFYRSNKAPRAQSAEWHKEATNVMDKASRLI